MHLFAIEITVTNNTSGAILLHGNYTATDLQTAVLLHHVSPDLFDDLDALVATLQPEADPP